MFYIASFLDLFHIKPDSMDGGGLHLKKFWQLSDNPDFSHVRRLTWFIIWFRLKSYTILSILSINFVKFAIHNVIHSPFLPFWNKHLKSFFWRYVSGKFDLSVIFLHFTVYRVNCWYCLQVEGFTRKDRENAWLYSSQAIAVIRDYLEAFPDLFEFLADNTSNDFFFASDIFPTDGHGYVCFIWLSIVCSYMVLFFVAALLNSFIPKISLLNHKLWYFS